jgi:erythromycin esterase
MEGGRVSNTPTVAFAHGMTRFRSAAMRHCCLLLVACLNPLLASLRAQALHNPGFERSGTDSSAVGWGRVGNDSYEIRVDRAVFREGRASVRIEGGTVGFGGLVQALSAEPFRGHGVVLKGAIRTEKVQGHAALWLRVDGNGQMISLDNMSDRGPSGSTPWQAFEIRMTVPTAAQRIVLGVLQAGAGTSWFDALTVSVDSTVTAPAWKPKPLEPPDSTLPEEHPAWVRQARATAFPIRSLDDRDFSDLTFLPGVIGGRRVVQLGESGHGVAEFDRAKVRLIRFLHERMGFDVVAFESSLFECWRADRMADTLSAEELMRSCIFAVWHTEEVLELFRYIKETRSTAHPLRLAGFDVQTSSLTARTRPDFWRALLTPVDPERANRVADLDSTFLSLRTDAAALAVRQDELVAGYRALERFLEENEASLVRAHADSAEGVAVAARLAASTIRFIHELVSDGAERTAARDEGMARNLDFLLTDLYPDAKVVTWGHNFHLRYANAEVDPNPMKTMGTWVAEKWRDQTYTIGLYMRWGRAATNGRTVYNVVAPSSGSLASILGHVGEPNLFVDLGITGEGPDGIWVREPITAKTWGQSDVTMILSHQYDGILFIDRVHPPTYLRR